MTTNKDSAVEEGTQGTPIPEGSDSSTGQRNSAAGVVTKEQYDALAREIESLKRGMQSEKDRAVKKTNERIDALQSDIQTVLREALNSGKSVGDLVKEIEESEEREFRQTLKELATSYRSGGEQGKAQKQVVNTLEIVKELEFDPEDMRVREFASQQFSTPEEAYKAAALLQRKIVSTTPSDADTASSEAKRKTFASKQEALRAEYLEGSKNLRGQALMNFKRAMRQKGLDIS